MYFFVILIFKFIKADFMDYYSLSILEGNVYSAAIEWSFLNMSIG